MGLQMDRKTSYAATDEGGRASGTILPPGEKPRGNSADELTENQRCLRLLSGKLFKYDDSRSYTSADEGETWIEGGDLISYRGLGAVGGSALQRADIQILQGTYRHRIVIPFYLEMDGHHPDYSRQQRGGYAIWKGKKVLLETHTHVPEMAGTYMNFSDDEGKTWTFSKGFLMGYFQDGHLGHWSCEEPVVAELKEGRLLCFMRSTCGRILKSYSADGGESWTKVAITDLAMSNSPCRLNRIPGTGDLVLVWNQMSTEEIRRGYRRGRLSVAISRDDGNTWERFKTLVQSPGVEPVTRVSPPPLTAMVRGGSGPDEVMDELPDDFVHFHYHEVYFSADGERFFVFIRVGTPAGAQKPIWRTYPTNWLYE